MLMKVCGDRPHELPPKPLVNAHLNPLYRSQQSHLNAKLQTTQSQNASLVEVLRRQKQEIEELVALVEKVVGDLGDAGGRLQGEGEGLSEEARGAERELGRVCGWDVCERGRLRDT
jgi:kinetochore protein NNF1